MLCPQKTHIFSRFSDIEVGDTTVMEKKKMMRVSFTLYFRAFQGGRKVPSFETWGEEVVA